MGEVKRGAKNENRHEPVTSMYELTTVSKKPGEVSNDIEDSSSKMTQGLQPAQCTRDKETASTKSKQVNSLLPIRYNQNDS